MLSLPDDVGFPPLGSSDVKMLLHRDVSLVRPATLLLLLIEIALASSSQRSDVEAVLEVMLRKSRFYLDTVHFTSDPDLQLRLYSRVE